MRELMAKSCSCRVARGKTLPSHSDQELLPEWEMGDLAPLVQRLISMLGGVDFG